MPATLARHGAPANPFSTRFHRPGALEFFFQAERGAESAENLYARFAQHGFRGQLTGPHGTGKTTLLNHLYAEFQTRGHAVLRVTLRDGQRHLPQGWTALLDTGNPSARASRRHDAQHKRPMPPALLFFEGAEQLSFPAWWLVGWHCRRRALGLLATTHRTLCLPDLYHTGVDKKLAEALAARVLAQNPALPQLVAAHEAATALAAAQGNMREALFRMYDWYETRWIHHAAQVT